MITVAYSSPLIPVEWIAAHGLRPWRLLPTGSASVRTSEGVCPYFQAIAQELSVDGPPLEAAILATTCDQMRRGHQTLAARLGRPVFLMNIPATWQSAASRQIYIDELVRLGLFLESLGGKAPSPSGLWQVMLAYDQARQALLACRERLAGRRFVERLHQLCQSTPDELESLTTEVRAESAANPVRLGRPAVAVVGGPMTARNLCVLDLIEHAGGRIALDATESGSRTLPLSLARGGFGSNPLVELAAAYFGAIGEIFRRPDSMLFETLGRELAACRPAGIVLVRQVWCDLWHAQVQRVRQEAALPLLDLDLAGEPTAALANRVQAFMEVLR